MIHIVTDYTLEYGLAFDEALVFPLLLQLGSQSRTEPGTYTSQLTVQSHKSTVSEAYSVSLPRVNNLASAMMSTNLSCSSDVLCHSALSSCIHLKQSNRYL